jgi:hypothetical protein
MRILYKNEKGQRVMRKSFCAFVDILGFSQKIKDNDTDFFNKYLKTLDEELGYIEEHYDLSNKNGYKEFELKIFTDNFVFGQPWFDIYGESELGNLFSVLSHIQLSFVKSNVFCRGGISVSDLLMDDNVVLGPALIESYKLESEKAIYPRIILSADVVEVLKKHIDYYGDKIDSPQNKEYLIDIDGYFFLNYLFILLYDYDSDNHNEFKTNLITELDLHKNSIVANLKMNVSNFKLFDKYSWCAGYHNYFCDNFIPQYFPELNIDEIKIDTKDYLLKIHRII